MKPISMLKAGIFTKGQSNAYGPAARPDPKTNKNSIPSGTTCRKTSQR